MTDDLPQLVSELRSIASQNVCDLPNMGDEAHEPPEITWGELDAIGRTADAAATALDSLTRALAEQQEAHRREGNEWVEAMFNTTTEMDRLREALFAMTQERDEAQRNRVEAIVAWDRMQERAVDAEEALTAAVREARAETEQLRREVNYQRARAVDAEARLAAESVRATAARAGQP